MATKSILKDVTIREQRLAHTFVKALEDAQKSKSDRVQMERTCKELTGEKVKAFFDK